MKLFAYHDVIGTAADVKNKFAEMERDNYPLEVYEYILNYHLDIGEPCVDVIGWACELYYTPSDDPYYSEVCETLPIIHTAEGGGVWHLAA